MYIINYSSVFACLLACLFVCSACPAGGGRGGASGVRPIRPLQARSTKRRDEISEGDFILFSLKMISLRGHHSFFTLMRSLSSDSVVQAKAAGHGVGRPGFNGPIRPVGIRATKHPGDPEIRGPPCLGGNYIHIYIYIYLSLYVCIYIYIYSTTRET